MNPVRFEAQLLLRVAFTRTRISPSVGKLFLNKSFMLGEGPCHDFGAVSTCGTAEKSIKPSLVIRNRSLSDPRIPTAMSLMRFEGSGLFWTSLFFLRLFRFVLPLGFALSTGAGEVSCGLAG